MLALVIGGAGFIGSHVVDRLLEEGVRVRVLDNLLPQAHPTGEARFLSKEAELVVGDIRDDAMVTRCLEGASWVFHLAGMVGNGQSMFDLRRYTDVNVVGTASLYEALMRPAARDTVERVVVSSSMVVYGDGAYVCPRHGPLAAVVRPTSRLEARLWEPICPREGCGLEASPVPTPEEHTQRPTSPYGISKQAQEALSLVTGRTFRIPTVALRYLNTYGSRQALSNPYTGVIAIMLSRLLNDKAPTLFEDGAQLRDFVHVSDVARANVLAARAGDAAMYQAFNIGTGRSTAIAEIARTLAERANKGIAPEVTGAFREGDIRHCFADVGAARALLGFAAETSLAQGFDELLAWGAHEKPEDHTDRANQELRSFGILR